MSDRERMEGKCVGQICVHQTISNPQEDKWTHRGIADCLLNSLPEIGEQRVEKSVNSRQRRRITLEIMKFIARLNQRFVFVLSFGR